MSISQKELDRMIREDYLSHEERLKIWAAAAESEFEEECREEVLGFLFWAQVEFHRRRTWLGLEEPELERHAALLLRTLSGRAEGKK